VQARRRPRYPGTHPRAFHDKYKELNPDRYSTDVQKVLAAGKTPAGTHVPVMVEELLQSVRPAPGEVVVDCTLGGGGHARAVLERLNPGGRLVGLDVDPLELPRTEAELRAAGFGADVLTLHHGNFADLPRVLATEGLTSVDIVFADLGVSSMQLDDPARGFGYKSVAALDMRMNPTRGEPASALLARLSETALATLLQENADEPHAAIIARLLKQQPLETTHRTERVVRVGLAAARPELSQAEIKDSVRRTFQALRMAVNDELSALETWLRAVPHCLTAGGRVAVITFHAGEDRRVEHAFQAGYRAGLFSDVARAAVRPSRAEIRANRRSSSARLRWAVRAAVPLHPPG
jgi:16S rRNA (cytosine1402-N4)-methyltransferase